MSALRRASNTHAITGNQIWKSLRERVAAFAKSAANLLLLIAIVSCAAPQAPSQRIILITIDTLRADRLGTRGYPRGVSPFLDGLAELIRLLTESFDGMQTQGEAMHSGAASPEVIEELKALGYL